MVPPETMAMPWPGLLLRVMSGSIVLVQLGMVLMSMAQVTNKVHVNVPGLDCHLKPCEDLRAGLPVGDILI